MSSTDASERARDAARARWGSRVVSRALATVADRADELNEQQWDLLAQLAEQKAGSDEHADH
jgi:hypothetical protein